MSLKLIGAGYGRTGTNSLKTALDLLGLGPCHHMYEIRRRPDQVKIWLDIAQGGPFDPEVALAGFPSQVDWPASLFWRELADRNPDSKVILTDRDPESWYASMERTILPGTLLGREKDPDPNNRDASEIIYRLVLQDLFEGRYEDRDYCIRKFKAHRAEVIDTIPSDRLLVFRTADGWNSLCRFLEIDIPAEPFPHTNSAAEFIARKSYMS